MVCIGLKQSQYSGAGNASERIASVACEIGVDLTVPGTHEYRSLHKHLLGTTADRLFSRMELPLLAVKV